ncbi:hypothetical protein FJW08_30465 [Mesorhizobium sp. B3-2-1]|uniref:hypothetical protein n=1 Tax=Mesorhizobium sp. B3-2-1 TaxID=2589891 RepID=UPI00112DC463|nr:hypothetical protein [Mesorhizobium sp. B3-2-1]TPI23857.1 hypothetical protein FJW08_30465 [Mesorhizobium sp. B3-2-1]
MTDADWAAVKGVVEVITLIIAVATFARAAFEYRRKNAMERFDKFQEMRERWDGSKVIAEILDHANELETVSNVHASVRIDDPFFIVCKNLFETMKSYERSPMPSADTFHF